jgi:hypothetical protein
MSKIIDDIDDAVEVKIKKPKNWVTWIIIIAITLLNAGFLFGGFWENRHTNINDIKEDVVSSKNSVEEVKKEFNDEKEQVDRKFENVNKRIDNTNLRIDNIYSKNK